MNTNQTSNHNNFTDGELPEELVLWLNQELENAPPLTLTSSSSIMERTGSGSSGHSSYYGSQGSQPDYFADPFSPSASKMKHSFSSQSYSSNQAPQTSSASSTTAQYGHTAG